MTSRWPWPQRFGLADVVCFFDMGALWRTAQVVPELLTRFVGAKTIRSATSIACMAAWSAETWRELQVWELRFVFWHGMSQWAKQKEHGNIFDMIRVRLIRVVSRLTFCCEVHILFTVACWLQSWFHALMSGLLMITVGLLITCKFPRKFALSQKPSEIRVRLEDSTFAFFPPVRGENLSEDNFSAFFYVWILCSCLLQPVGNLETLIYRKWCTENWCIMIRVIVWCRSASPGHSKCHFPKDYDYNPLPEVKRGKDERWECGTWWCRRHVLTDCEIHIRWENKRGRPECWNHQNAPWSYCHGLEEVFAGCQLI